MINRRAILVIGAAATLAGCSESATPTRSPDKPSEPSTPQAAAPTPDPWESVEANGDAPRGPSDEGPPSAAPGDAESAKRFATDTITLLLDNSKDTETWWKAVGPRLTPEAQEIWKYTETRRIPDAEITGPARVLTVSGVDAEVEVPTTLGTWTVVLFRNQPTDGWKASAIEIPQDSR